MRPERQTGPGRAISEANYTMHPFQVTLLTAGDLAGYCTFLEVKMKHGFSKTFDPLTVKHELAHRIRIRKSSRCTSGTRNQIQ